MSSSSSFFSGTNPTPTEYQTSVDLVAQATQKAAASLASANASAASATSSQGYSVAAGTSATTATNQAASATTSAAGALSSQNAAASSATSASGSATTATTQATNASNSASAASTSATNASNSASAASTSATNAASSASAAATSASNAAATLSGAMVKASNLSDVASVSTARTNLGVAIGSNVQAWDADLDAIAAISGTNGLLRKTAANTWSLDTTSYLSGTVAVANGGTGGTTSTGSGSVVLANSPTLVTPALGTPSSGNLANCTFPTLNQNTTGTAANVTGTVAVANGGTGLTSLTAGYIPYGNGTGALSSSASFYINPAGNVLTLTGLTSFAPQIICWNQAVDNTAAYLILRKSRGGSGAGAATVAGDVLGTYLFSGFDSGGVATNSSYLMATASAIGSGNVDSAVSLVAVGSTSSLRFGTNSSERMRIDSVGNVGIGTTTANPVGTSNNVAINGSTTSSISLSAGGTLGAYFSTNASSYAQFVTPTAIPLLFVTNNVERMRIDGSGLIGINTGPTGNVQVNISGIAPSASNTSYVVYNSQTIPAASTTIGNGFTTSLSTAASAFTCGSINHFQVNQSPFGNGSIVTNQIGYSVAASLTGGTTNIGYASSIALGTGNQYIGTSTISSIASSGTTTTVVTTAAHALTTGQVVTVAATANATALVSGVTCTILTVGTTDFTLIGAASNTVGVSFIATGAGTGNGTVRINQQGSGKAVTVVDTTTFTYTSTTGTYTAITASGTITPSARYNIYVSGTAPSYFATAVGIGTINPRGRLEIANTTSSGMAFTATAETTDGKTWDLLVGGGNFAIRTVNDAYSAASTAFIIGRTGNLVTSHIWYTSNAERMRIDSSGLVAIGSTTAANTQLQLGGAAPTAGTASYCINVQQTIPSGSTAAGVGYSTTIATQAASFNCATLAHFNASLAAIGAGSTVTNQYGFIANNNIIGATNNFAFFGNIPSGTGRWNFYAGGTADNYFAGNVGIGTTSPAYKLDILGSSFPQVTIQDNKINSTVKYAMLSVGHYTNSQLPASLISGQSTLTDNSVFIGGAYSQMNAATTIRFFTALNTTTAAGAERMVIDFSGRVGIGSTPNPSTTGLTLGGTATGGSVIFQQYLNYNVASDVTAFARGIVTNINTNAASFTLSNLEHYYAGQGTIGAGSAITNQIGYRAAANIIGATNNYGFYGDIPSGTGRYNFYAAGTADNYFAGNVGIGALPSSKLEVYGKLKLSGGESNQLEWLINSYNWKANVSGSNGNWYLLDAVNNKFPFTIAYNTPNGTFVTYATGGFGYGTGSGGTVTQATSRTTGVTLNKPSGAITLVSAAGSTAWQSFTVTNSTVAATDTIIVNQDAGTDLYQIFVTNVAAGSFRITFATTGGTTTEQPVFNFAVIKAVTS